jgi:hypothetical protein
MNRILKLLFAAIWIFCISQCREPFQPDFETGVHDHLVVEGFIHVGEKSVTQIKLSRVAPLEKSNAQQFVETSAEVKIESEAGEEFILHESVPGTYHSDSINLNTNGSYRVVIKRSSGLEYSSSFTTAIETPPIDSIHWQVDAVGIHILVSTHDAANDSKFYIWDYQETWEINSAYKSNYKYEDGIMKDRFGPIVSHMRFCWKNAFPEDNNFASTEGLTQDVMHYKLASFGHQAERFQVKYSIIVHQRSPSEDEYRFLQLIRKNSNATGSLFDPLPAEVRGNVISTTSAAIPVIGYVGAYTTDSKRIFIYPSDIEMPPVGKCELSVVTFDQIQQFFGELGYIPVDSIGVDQDGKTIFTAAPSSCMDCRFYGDPARPDYWN